MFFVLRAVLPLHLDKALLGVADVDPAEVLSVAGVSCLDDEGWVDCLEFLLISGTPKGGLQYTLQETFSEPKLMSILYKCVSITDLYLQMFFSLQFR